MCSAHDTRSSVLRNLSKLPTHTKAKVAQIVTNTACSNKSKMRLSLQKKQPSAAIPTHAASTITSHSASKQSSTTNSATCTSVTTTQSSKKPSTPVPMLSSYSGSSTSQRVKHSPTALQDLSNQVHGQQEHKCTECGKTYAHRSGLSRHTKQSHSDVERGTMSCPNCSARYDTIYRYMLHAYSTAVLFLYYMATFHLGSKPLLMLSAT